MSGSAENRRKAIERVQMRVFDLPEGLTTAAFILRVLEIMAEELNFLEDS